MPRNRLVMMLSGLLCAASVRAFQPDLSSLDAVPAQPLPPAALAQGVEASKGQPLAFAAGIPMNLGHGAGSWDFPEPAIARWRLRLSSEDALNLSVNLGELQLPEAGELWLYSSDGRDVQGPFTQAGLLPLVRGNGAVLEARMPSAARGQFRLGLDQVYHGFRAFADELPQSKGQIGTAEGACHVDVACADGSGWRDQIRSAVLYTRTESGLLFSTLFKCSGVLVNNTAQNNRALILTANHCGITASTRMSDVKVYFNVQKPSCGSASNGPINQVINGGRFLARDADADFTLFELASLPPSGYNVHYAGWDARSGVAPRSGVGVHHPAGDDKKISTYGSSARARDNVTISSGTLGSFTIDSWEVTWANGKGVTEPGSSGSGLWNQDRRVVGVLSGGSSSCDNPERPDQYARLDRAWTANSAGTGQLKVHLDPTGSNSLILDGRNAGSSAAPLPANSGANGGGSSGGGGGGALGWWTLAILLGMRLRGRKAGR